jgi:hypothetical protein
VRICQLCVEAVGAEINYPPITTILRLEGKPVTNIPEFHLRCGGCRATMVSGNLEAGTAEGSSLSEAEVLQIFAEAAQKFTEGSVDHLRYQLCYHFLRENDGWTLIPPCEGLPWQQPQWFCPHCTKVIQAGIGDTLPEADKSQIITAMMQAANPIHHT